MIEVTDIKGVGPAKAETLEENGYESVEDIAQADPDELAAVDGVGDDRALEFMMDAGDLLDAEAEVEEETEGDEFDLTPSEVSDELEEQAEEEDDSPEIETVDEEETSDSSEADPIEDEEEAEGEATYEVTLNFETMLQYDVFHAALMRHHENVYTSYQPASESMQKLLDGLDDFDSVTYELTEFDLNTLHTAVKQTRSDYQGNNLIDHMDALNLIEDQVDEQRREYLFD